MAALLTSPTRKLGLEVLQIGRSSVERTSSVRRTVYLYLCVLDARKRAQRERAVGPGMRDHHEKFSLGRKNVGTK